MHPLFENEWCSPQLYHVLHKSTMFLMHLHKGCVCKARNTVYLAALSLAPFIPACAIHTQALGTAPWHPAPNWQRPTLAPPLPRPGACPRNHPLSKDGHHIVCFRFSVHSLQGSYLPFLSLLVWLETQRHSQTWCVCVQLIKGLTSVQHITVWIKPKVMLTFISTMFGNRLIRTTERK